MLLFSVNFNSYYLIGRGRWKDAFTTEVKAFFLIVFSAMALITANLLLSDLTSGNYNFGEALKHTAFTVASIISTTGFSTENFDLWPQFSKTILVLLMFVGACAGSTGGGMKVSRFVLLGKSAKNEVGKMLHPKQIKRVTMDGRAVDEDVIRSICGYLIAYVAIFVASFLIISLDLGNLTHGESGAFATGFTSVLATLNNIGPGLGAVGPVGSFTDFSWWAKLVFIFDMIAGRLEIFPILLRFAPMTWRKGA
jgi:trk system potassium uptake protein TrkH